MRPSNDCGYAMRIWWVCKGKFVCASNPVYKHAKQTHPHLIYTAAFGEVPASLSFIECIPGCIELYLANQGGMGDDLSLDPYVSGNFEASAPPKVSTHGSWRSGVVGRSAVGFLQGLVHAGNSHTPKSWVTFLGALPDLQVACRAIDRASICWYWASVGSHKC
jgi:hypothetical protein